MLKKSDLLIIVLLSIVIILTRTVLSIPPNVELVTALTFVAAFLLKNKFVSAFVLLISMFVSDILIGNTVIYLFTWSGFLAPIIFGIILSSSKLKIYFQSVNKYLKNALFALNAGVLSTFFFFLWTNLGVVLTTTMYPKSLDGLLSSYTNALPFLRNQMLGNMVLVPLIAVIFTILQSKEFALYVKNSSILSKVFVNLRIEIS